MKYIKIPGLVVLGLLVFASASWADRAPKSAVKSSPHDFMNGINGGGEWTTASYALCSYCHVAHKFGSAPTAPGYLLWNHTLSSTASYGVYTSESMVNPATDLGGQMTVSNLCLSCHDGTVAINSFYEDIPTANFQSTVGSQTQAYMEQDHVVNDLSRQHPINFDYPSAAQATNIGIRAAVDTHSVDGNGTVPLYNNRMQCATCHDPHAGPSYLVNGQANHLFFRAFPVTAEVTSTGVWCVYCHK